MSLDPKLHVALDRSLRLWSIQDGFSNIDGPNKRISSPIFTQTGLNLKSLALRNRSTETNIAADSDKGKYGGQQEKFWRYQIYHAIDSCISTVFSHRRSSASQNISRDHMVESTRVSSESLRGSPPPSDGADRIEPSRNCSTEASNLNSGTGARATKSSPSSKRGLSLDGQEDCEKSDLARRKRRPPSYSTLSSPTFACHFHKKDPHKYCSFTDERYRNCIHPRIPSIRRIKYDLI
jgi:hypothetical protein